MNKPVFQKAPALCAPLVIRARLGPQVSIGIRWPHLLQFRIILHAFHDHRILIVSPHHLSRFPRAARAETRCCEVTLYSLILLILCQGPGQIQPPPLPNQEYLPTLHLPLLVVPTGRKLRWKQHHVPYLRSFKKVIAPYTNIVTPSRPRPVAQVRGKIRWNQHLVLYLR